MSHTEEIVSASPAKSEISGDRPSLSIEAPIPLEGRTVTVQNETTQLALIIQRTSKNDVSGEDVDVPKLQQVDEGHEFTLEDHQSASG